MADSISDDKYFHFVEEQPEKENTGYLIPCRPAWKPVPLTTPPRLRTSSKKVFNEFSDTFGPVGELAQRAKPRPVPVTGSPRHSSDLYSRESEANMLTMALIGCLPDNVQQAIKSFSIRPGKQHITFAFPFMEESLRCFCDTGQLSDIGDNVAKSRYVTSVLFFDECLEVIHGFQTYVTVLPHLKKSSLPVVMLTLYQRDTSEGICRHFQSLIQILLEHRSSSGTIWKLPTMVAELSGKYRELVLEACAETVSELQAEALCHSFPGKSADQMVSLVKEKLLRPCLISYGELLRRNIQEAVTNLTTTDPAYFLSLLELLQSTGCSILDFKKVDMMFKNPGIDAAIREFWKIWGHEQISRKVFPVTMATTPLSKLGPLYSRLGGTPGGATEAVVSVGSLSHVPVKEGLQSVIKCLKSQEISQVKPRETEHQGNLHSCNCSVCKIQPQARRNTRLRLYGGFAKNPTVSSSESSAFHLPFQKGTVTHNESLQSYSARPAAFRIPPTNTMPYHSSLSPDDHRMPRDYQPFSSTDIHKSSTEMSYTDTASSADRQAYSHASSRHVVQPVPHYFPINLKAFSQRVLYGYPMLNKSQYSLALNSRHNA